MRTLYLNQYIVVRTQSGFHSAFGSPFLANLAFSPLAGTVLRSQQRSRSLGGGLGKLESLWTLPGLVVVLLLKLSLFSFLFSLLARLLSTVTQDLVADLFPTQPLPHAPPHNLLGKRFPHFYGEEKQSDERGRKRCVRILFLFSHFCMFFTTEAVYVPGWGPQSKSRQNRSEFHPKRPDEKGEPHTSHIFSD